MASGKTLKMIALGNEMRSRIVIPREKRDRDRTLAGKKRSRVRRAAR